MPAPLPRHVFEPTTFLQEGQVVLTLSHVVIPNDGPAQVTVLALGEHETRGCSKPSTPCCLSTMSVTHGVAHVCLLLSDVHLCR